MEFQKVSLKIEVDNAAELSNKQKTDPKEFALIRRNGFGASDAATLLDVSPWSGITELIDQKASTEVTEKELAIGEMPQVRMGAELEPFVLGKFEEWSGLEVIKPDPMYRIAEFPQLTVNFDGLIHTEGHPLYNAPVEAKVVSMFGEGKKDNKYWTHEKAMKSIDEIPVHRHIPTERLNPDTIRALAKECGIPVYYYTQCQQQMLAANSEHCFLTAMHTKDWTFRVYHVPRCEAVIGMLKQSAYVNWKKVETKRIMNKRK